MLYTDLTRDGHLLVLRIRLPGKVASLKYFDHLKREELLVGFVVITIVL